RSQWDFLHVGTWQQRRTAWTQQLLTGSVGHAAPRSWKDVRDAPRRSRLAGAGAPELPAVLLRPGRLTDGDLAAAHRTVLARAGPGQLASGAWHPHRVPVHASTAVV